MDRNSCIGTPKIIKRSLQGRLIPYQQSQASRDRIRSISWSSKFPVGTLHVRPMSLGDRRSSSRLQRIFERISMHPVLFGGYYTTTIVSMIFIRHSFDLKWWPRYGLGFVVIKWIGRTTRKLSCSLGIGIHILIRAHNAYLSTTTT